MKPPGLSDKIKMESQRLRGAFRVGKGLSATDTAILKKVESIIEQEFSFSLKMNAQGVGAYIRKRLGPADGNDPVPTEN